MASVSALVDEFVAYAETCFKHFGDLVQWWFTFNEPHSTVTGGYIDGRDAPARSEHPDTEPYIVGTPCAVVAIGHCEREGGGDECTDLC